MQNSRRFIPLFGLAAFAGLMLAPRPAAAQTPAIGFTPNAYGVTDNASDTGASSYSLGFEFTANSPEFVTSLGYFTDPSFDPNNPFGTVPLNPPSETTDIAAAQTGPSQAGYNFADSHQVGLYQVVPATALTPETGLLLAQATITQSSTPNGDFLYEALTTPVPLITGDAYVLAGVTGGTDPFVFDIEDDSQPNAVGLTTNGITYVQDVSTVSSTLAFPGTTDAGSSPGFFGPNMILSPNAPVPEASTTVSLGLLLALGLGGLGLSARRRSRSL